MTAATESARAEIDAIDDQLADLYLRRLRAVSAVSEAKRAAGLPVRDPARERAILARVAGKMGPDLAPDAVLLFNTIFSLSRARQRALLAGDSPLVAAIRDAADRTPAAFPSQAVVACQGTEGAYSQLAAAALFPIPTLLFFNSFKDVFSAVEKGMCRYGILPVENSSAGSVTAVYDQMVRHRFHIVRAVRQRIAHVLLAPPGVDFSEIREITSHAHALAQCSGFLHAHPGIRQTPAANTAVAARALAASGRRDLAVIASRPCADLYNLAVLRDDVSDAATNYTRFICISKDLEIYPDSRKFSIMMSLPHRPGSLGGVLGRFTAIGVNLTKLESRPIPGMDFEFLFTFDFEARPQDPAVLRLLAELAADPEIERFTFLGAYAET
jgi:chorismate mutase/prephenate dehydratase